MNFPALGGLLKLGSSKGIIFLGALLVLLIVLTIGTFTYINVKDAEQKQHLAIVSEQRLLSQQLATQALEAADGKPGAFVELKKLRDSFDAAIETLENGDDNSVPLPPELIQQLQEIKRDYAGYRENVNTILSGQDAIFQVREFVELIDEQIPQLLAFSDEVVSILVSKKGITRQQIYIAARQLMLTQRIENNMNRVLAGGAGAATAADRFGRDSALFGRVLEGMIKGLPELGIKKVTDQGARGKLREIAMLFSSISEHVGAILEVSPQLFEIKDAANAAEDQSTTLLGGTTRLEETLLSHTETELTPMIALGYLLAMGALIMLLLLGYMIYQDTRNRLAVTTEQNRRNQRAILRLLDEMTNLADGDLSVHATVTEDITGAIADSVNYAIDALRDLVTTINKTAVQVSAAAESTQSTAMRLADASNHQAREIASASAAITDMADSIEQVSLNSISSAEVAEQAVDIAGKGAKTVRATIDGMNEIREQIQETSKRIKRLGESSQEIGDIVGLINDIADQTNILALNAAIQASSAGEAGRGFAVVADEVQRLAERSANATKQIEALVKTIQADTNEAVISMEHSTSNVVKGARLAENAGTALGEIETVSARLADLIQQISQTAKQQASVASNVSNTMNVIQEITMQTSEGTNDTASSIGNLTTLATDLRRSVSGFKLPESDQMDTVILDDLEHADNALA